MEIIAIVSIFPLLISRDIALIILIVKMFLESLTWKGNNKK